MQKSNGNTAKVSGIRCPKCGRRIAALQELLKVQSVGLAMFGTCPTCGGLVPCAELWRKARAVTK